jgi:1-acyl-sn-glycerol-3-phosphate acyltransferase
VRIAAARTLVGLLAVALYILLVAPPVLLWTALSRRPEVMYRAGAAGVRLGFTITGIRLRTVGADRLQPASVYACNHASNLDPPVVMLALRSLFPRVQVLYKAELRRLPVLVWVFDAAGFIPLERGNPGQSRPAIDRAAAALQAGSSFLIFPEGTRSRTGELLPFKKGGFVMAIKAQAPIVPVSVSGGREAMRKGSRVIWPATITVRFGTPIQTVGRTADDREEVVAAVRGAIAAGLAP